MTTETDRLPKSFKDRDGNTYYRNDLGRYWCRKNIGPLTDFEYDEPAPEPAKFEKCWTCANGVGWYCFCDEPAPEPTPRKPEHGCGNCEGVDPKSCVMDHDTPPEPGDRVRVTYEATLGEPDYDGTPLTVVKTHDNIAIHNIIPADAEITVIERAAPKVPEPEVGEVVEIDHGIRFVHRTDEAYGWVTTKGSAKYSWDELRRYFGTLYTVERGAVIGGE